MRIHTLLTDRLLMFVIAACVCLWLGAVRGPWAAIGLWAVGIGGLCGAVAWLIHKQMLARITPLGRIAGIVLPWGYTIGRGTLLPILIESWFRWLLLGVAVVVLMPHGFGGHGNAAAGYSPAPANAYHRGMIATVALFLSWVVNATAAFRLIAIAATRIQSGMRVPGGLAPVGGILALTVASVVITIFAKNTAMTGLALILAGGPVVLIGGVFGFVLLIALTRGRHARWN